ncbi:hypothetical protein GJ496_009089 [Pomphorhynchus laevis]|nr:hypothetical protein GJ496_009089 [Pomphorhynchus laevis]
MSANNIEDDKLVDLKSVMSEPDRLVSRRQELLQKERELICKNYEVILLEGKHLHTCEGMIRNLSTNLNELCKHGDSIRRLNDQRHSDVDNRETLQLGEMLAFLPIVADTLSIPKRVQDLIDVDKLEQAFHLANDSLSSTNGNRIAPKLRDLIQIILDKLITKLGKSSVSSTLAGIRILLLSNKYREDKLKFVFLKNRLSLIDSLKNDKLSYVFDTVTQYRAAFGNEDTLVTEFLLRSWLLNVITKYIKWSDRSIGQQTLSRLGVDISPILLQKEINQIEIPFSSSPPKENESDTNVDVIRVKQAFDAVKQFCPLSLHSKIRKHILEKCEANEVARNYAESCMRKLFPNEQLRKYLLIP